MHLKPWVCTNTYIQISKCFKEKENGCEVTSMYVLFQNSGPVSVILLFCMYYIVVVSVSVYAKCLIQ